MFFTFRNKIYNLDKIRKFSISETVNSVGGHKFFMEVFYEGELRELIEFSSVEESTRFCLSLHNGLRERVGLIEINDDFWRSNIHKLEKRDK